MGVRFVMGRSPFVFFSSCLFLTGILLVGIPEASHGIGINVWGDLTTSFQSLETNRNPTEEGFGDVRSNLHIGSSVRQDLYAYTELQSRREGTVELHEMYFTLEDVVGNFSLKSGRFQLGFGLPFYYRSDNAEAGQNALVGDPVVDPYATQDGAEVVYRGDEYSLRGSLTSGTDEPGVSANRSFGKTVRLYRYRDELGWSLSYYASDQSSTEETTNFLVDPASEAYHGLTNTDTRTTKATSPGQGNNLEVIQFDLRYDPNPNWTANLFVGQLEDDTSAYANKLRYYTVRYEQKIMDESTLIGQFGEARYETIQGNDPGGNSVRRIQVGLMHRLYERTQVKLEYVQQEADSGLSAHLDTRRPVDFNGLITQVYVNF